MAKVKKKGSDIKVDVKRRPAAHRQSVAKTGGETGEEGPIQFEQRVDATLQKQSLCACDKCLLEDPLLPKSRFNSSIQPFLSAKHKLSEDAFNWWKHLQNEKRTFGTYEATVGKLFEIFPPSPDLTEPSPDRCRTCAVVGNSVNLKGSHYGALIDVQDFILRMNAAHIKGFEADVGNRTTHRVMYPESAVDLDNTTHLVLFPFKILDLEWLIKASTTGFSGVSYAPMKSKIKVNKDLVMVVNPAFMRYVHEIWLKKKGSYPSTGFMTFILALHICDEVSVFGFGADRNGSWSHYWEKLKNKEFKTGMHPGHHEYTMIKELAEQKVVRFYKGW
ncbi:CMP-N-acetylneuraminate-beta-galactosamide-alpha-2,3-sialyltransferase 1-like [Odontesthes bonariensis]|uniref:CMP-N-acetylneuraminate-beta-galactosamide- alpha-2,3-sialyltransferase 1-like n=1 Tax=Odontesthes bonariensis TaxID=219752 RepID=UPI003F590200